MTMLRLHIGVVEALLCNTTAAQASPLRLTRGRRVEGHTGSSGGRATR